MRAWLAACAAALSLGLLPARLDAAPEWQFQLTTLSGRDVTMADYRGKWLLIYFGYTFCPDVCPTTLSELGGALKALGPRASRVQVLFITVDPNRDKTAVLARYLKAFDPRIEGLRGDPEETENAAKSFHVYYRLRSVGHGEYAVDHSSYVYVFDPQGRFVQLLAPDAPGHKIAEDPEKNNPVKSLAFLFLAIGVHSASAAAVSHFADPDNPALVSKGREIYMTACSSCHGRRLQGQALWQVMDQYAGRRAPPQDGTGHTWQHSDEDLFWKTRTGRFPWAPPHGKTYMPAFGGDLSDQEILAVLAFIKSSWPLGMRASQATLNPGRRGMPKNLGHTIWTLPPNCTGSSSFLQWTQGRDAQLAAPVRKR